MVKQAVRERRNWVRAKRVLSIEFRLKKGSRKGGDSDWHLSTTHDMSLGGLTFFTDIEYRMGDTLELHVVMSGILDIFNGLGKIVRIEKKKSGSYFLVAVRFLSNKLTYRKAKAYTSKKRLALTAGNPCPGPSTNIISISCAIMARLM